MEKLLEIRTCFDCDPLGLRGGKRLLEKYGNHLAQKPSNPRTPYLTHSINSPNGAKSIYQQAYQKTSEYSQIGQRLTSIN